MIILTKDKIVYCLLFFFLWSTNSIAQKKYDRLLIEKGDTLLINDSFKAKDFIIQGVVIVNDKRDIILQVGNLIIDGGTFQVGTKQNPYQSKLNIQFVAEKKKGVGLHIKNKGSLLFYGNSSDITSSSEGKKAIRNRHITITNASNSLGAVTIENARKVEISCVQFNGLGVKSGDPALKWFGQTDHESYIQNCVFINSMDDDLHLDKTTATISKNIFISQNGTSIRCSTSGIGQGNIISSNYIENSSGQNALIMYNPYQSIINNDIKVSGSTDGIVFTKQKGYEGYNWTASDKLFVIKENRLENVSNNHESAGLHIEDFEHAGIWKVEDNSVTNFKVGLVNQTKNVVFADCEFINNEIGMIPGSAYIQNSRLSTNSIANTSSIGLFITDSISKSAPKVSKLNIINYGVGIQFEGKIEADNYFEKISFKNTKPISFQAINSASFINDKDGSLSLDLEGGPSVENDHSHHQMGHGIHSNTMKQSSSGYIMFPEASIFKTANSVLHDDSNRMLKSNKNLFGTLTIATGFGLQDPVHEHNGVFKKITLLNNFNDRAIHLKNLNNKKEVMLAANNVYDLEYELSENPIYDLSFEWEGAPNTWILLKVPYIHKNVVGIRSFGSKIPSANSIKALENSKVTTYYYDNENKVAHIKIYNQQHLDEFVLYSSHILTEISVDDKKVPLQMISNTRRNEVIVSCELSEKTKATLNLLDYYGNVVKTLFTGIPKKGKLIGRVDLNEFDVSNNTFLYSLEVDGKVHRGPVHVY
ncbi:G8 domain-containing protein [Spongiivirga sp. MCCC 1A20706]|uniref:G8 domain-containing protein n=1 Tax=Spongiivirga sp. MCCC 1A20706 TaxID=3160963 RepID=UPI003977A5F3